jgi:aminodeoxyfutalosine deaminase
MVDRAQLRLLHAASAFTGEVSVRDFALVVDAAGVIFDAGPAVRVRREHADLNVETFDGVLFPGLVNAHTHLELSGLRGQIQRGLGFTRWLDAMMRARQAAANAPTVGDSAVVRAAVSEFAHFGVIGIGEVTNSLVAFPEIVSAGLRGCIFHEIFGLAREPTLLLYEQMLEHAAQYRLSAGLSYHRTPHALHTVHRELLEQIAANHEADEGSRLSFHLAEHPAERQLLEEGVGPMADWLTARGLHCHVPGCPPTRFAEELGLCGSRTLVVHLADARDDEIAALAGAGVTVVLCPRSNAYIEGNRAPVSRMLDHGVRLALGTDSLASNDSLDPLAEAAELRSYVPSAHDDVWLRAATSGGAAALGIRDAGVFAPGGRPGIFFVAASGGGTTPASSHLLSNLRASRRRLDLVLDADRVVHIPVVRSRGTR